MPVRSALIERKKSAKKAVLRLEGLDHISPPSELDLGDGHESDSGSEDYIAEAALYGEPRVARFTSMGCTEIEEGCADYEREFDDGEQPSRTMPSISPVSPISPALSPTLDPSTPGWNLDMGVLSPSRDRGRSRTPHKYGGADSSSEPSPASQPPATPQSGAAARKFSKCVLNCVGKEYVLVTKNHLMEIKLMVFVHRRHRSRIGKTETMTEATGIGNVVGNKGGVAVKLCLDDTTICFVSSHLAAHEGSNFCQQRNDNVTQIMRSLEKTGRSVFVPAVHQFNHIIWMGDLNYRIDVQQSVPQATAWDHERKWDHVQERISQGKLKELAECDELRREMDNENVFACFKEGDFWGFQPTFKVSRGVSTAHYQQLRIPSWCDRVLYYSLPRHSELLKIREYASVESYATSDHKPVYAVFDLALPKRIRRYGATVPKTAIKCTLDFLSLRVNDVFDKRSQGDAGLDAAMTYDVLEDGALSPRFTASEAGMSMLDEGDVGFGSCDAGVPSSGVAPIAMDHAGGGISANGWDGGGAGGDTSAGALSYDSMNDRGLGTQLSQPSPHSPTLPTPTARAAEQAAASRRGVKVEFYGSGLFLRDKTFRTEVPLRANGTRECSARELPTIPLVPLESLNDLTYKYVTIVFSRWGSKAVMSCVLPLGDLAQAVGLHRVTTELELTRFGRRIGTVEVDVELCISMECWIDSRNNVVKARGR